jgi:aminotransferase
MLYEGDQYTPAECEAYKQHTIRIVSFSKDFAMTGWRIGYLHTDGSRLPSLLAIHDTLVNCAPVVAQYAALAALKESEHILARNRSIYDHHRQIMLKYLRRCGPRIQYQRPDGAYFFFVKLPQGWDSSRFCNQLLVKKQVAMVPGDDFGPGGEGYVRFCFGRGEEAVLEGMQRFVEFIRQDEYEP